MILILYFVVGLFLQNMNIVVATSLRFYVIKIVIIFGKVWTGMNNMAFCYYL